ncbi:MAG: glycerol kinase GlpK [Bdellovibrionales bacterium]|nr:glycerol kinase GlpK [Bdellovibrionales bacterium]
MSKFILAIDQGTTGTTVSIINSVGLPVAKGNHEFSQIFPNPGWVEHNPNEIWETVLKGIRRALDQASISGEQIAAIGITNQRETTLVWDRKTGEPIYNAIVWQCRRTTDVCQKLKKEGHQKTVKQKTGLVLDPYFSATKFHWILANTPKAMKRAEAGELAGGNIDTFLVWRLTGGKKHYTDVSNASRTSLMDLKTQKWDKKLLKLFKVPEALLPEIGPSAGHIAVTNGVPGLPDGVPITGIAGDQQAALFGQTAFKVGEAKCTFGTGSFLLMNTGKELVRSRSGLLTTVAWQLEGQPVSFALEGGAFICGAAVQWLRDGLKIIKHSSDVEKLARSVEECGGVQFVPALTGLGAPYWEPEARGLITGLTRGATQAHIARATLEAMALQNVDILISMQKDLKKKMRALKVDGGAVANDLLMQMQSDFLGVKVQRPQVIETTAAGAAYLAGIGVGMWTLDDLKKIVQVEREFQPNMTKKQREIRLHEWHRAIRQTTSF